MTGSDTLMVGDASQVPRQDPNPADPAHPADAGDPGDPVAVMGWLAGPGAAPVLAAATDLADRLAPLAVAERLRQRFPQLPATLLAAASGQVALRARAAPRLGPHAGRLLLTRDGLEQASRRSVADHRAASLAARSPGPVHEVADLCCGIGGDLLALAAAGFQVTGVDLDPVAVIAARANVAANGLTATIRLGDVTDLDRSGFDAVVADPARRTANGRIRDPADFRPDWSWVRSVLTEPGARAVVTTTPALPHRLIPDGCEAEWVGQGRDVVEAALWSPEMGSGVRRRATLLGPDGTRTMTDSELSHTPPPVGDPAAGDILIEPHGVVIRAGLVGVLADRVGGYLPAPGIGYLLAPAGAIGPDVLGPDRGPDWGTAFTITEVLPLRERVLRRRLADDDVGILEIMQRGLDISPDALRPRLIGTRPRGHGAATLVLTRTRSGGAALLVSRLTGD